MKMATKENLTHFKKTEIVQAELSDDNILKLELNKSTENLSYLSSQARLECPSARVMWSG